MVHKRI